MKILIFGSGGFIGSHLTISLIKENKYEVVGYDTDFSKLRKLCGNRHNFTFIKGDIRKNIKRIEKQIGNSDIVVDLIAYANPSIYISRPLEVVKLNLFDNLKIAEMCLKFRKHLIQFSSCEVYGMMNGARESFSEDNSKLVLGPIKNHRWIYSCAKQLLERVIHAYGLEKGFNYTIIRPFNFIGPEMDYILEKGDEGNPRVFPHFISALLFNRELKLVDGGHNYRTFTYIDDAVEAIKLIIRNINGVCNREIINIGTPNNEIKIRDLAILMVQIFEELTEKKANCNIVEISSKEFYGEGYEDCDRRIPDINKLLSLGWKPKYNLEQTLRLSMKYYFDKYMKRE